MIPKNVTTAFLSDSEAGVCGAVIASGLYLITVLQDPWHKIAALGVCAIVAISYKWARTLKKTNESDVEARRVEAEADKAEARADAAEALSKIKSGET